MTARMIAKASLIPVGFQTTSLLNSTAVAVNSTCREAHVLFVSVETNSARYRDDGTDPTLTTGVVIPKDVAPFKFEGYNGSSVLKFQRTTGTSKISIAAYRHFTVNR